jgi:hypothetical protein
MQQFLCLKLGVWAITTMTSIQPYSWASVGIRELEHLPSVDIDDLFFAAIGFCPPVLRARLKLETDLILPNIIALPYGRCPPLHIHASSWTHLLTLLARMGYTKFEPSEKAVSTLKMTNAEVKLRTVIQFVRVSASHAA